MKSDFDTEYDVSTALLQSYGASLERLIQDLLKAESIRSHSVICRVKSKESCVRKLQRSDGEGLLSSLTDVLGVRIITYFRDDVDAAAKVIEREFSIDRANSVDKSAVLDPDRFGYLSVHYISQVGVTRADLPEYRGYSNIKFEIQIRSILQHAWAEIEHDLGYKSEAAIPKRTRRRFSRLAGLLELADDEFIAIRQQLVTHQVNSTTIIGQGDLDVEVDQDSLYSFIVSDPRVKALDLFLAELMERPYADQDSRSYIGERVEQLIAVGFHSIDELSKYLDSEEVLLKEFCAQWAEFTEKIRNEMLSKQPEASLQTVPKGYSLYYIYLLKAAQLSSRGELSEEQEEIAKKQELKRLLKSALQSAGVRGTKTGLDHKG